MESPQNLQRLKTVLQAQGLAAIARTQTTNLNEAYLRVHQVLAHALSKSALPSSVGALKSALARSFFERPVLEHPLGASARIVFATGESMQS